MDDVDVHNAHICLSIDASKPDFLKNATAVAPPISVDPDGFATFHRPSYIHSESVEGL